MSKRYYTNEFKRAVRLRQELARFDENTFYKVLVSLIKSGLSENQAIKAAIQMQNDGILFRERI